MYQRSSLSYFLTILMVMVLAGALLGCPSGARFANKYDQLHPRLRHGPGTAPTPNCKVGVPSVEYAQIFEHWATIEELQSDWIKALPDCPCSITPSDKGSCPPAPLIIDSIPWSCAQASGGSVLNFYHPGASFELRYRAQNTGNGQQCTYDTDGKLINQGPAAGTADRAGPLGTNEDRLQHRSADVDPFCAALCADGFIYGDNIQRYLQVRPANQGKGCEPNSPHKVDKNYNYDPSLSNASCKMSP